MAMESNCDFRWASEEDRVDGLFPIIDCVVMMMDCCL